MMVQSGTRIQDMDAVAWESTAVEVSSGPASGASAADVAERDDEQPAGGPDRSAIAALVQAAAAGDQQAWNGLVDKFASTVWAIARGYRLNAPPTPPTSPRPLGCASSKTSTASNNPNGSGPGWLPPPAGRRCASCAWPAARFPTATTSKCYPTSPPRSPPTAASWPSNATVWSPSWSSSSPSIPNSSSACSSAPKLCRSSYRDISEALAMPIGSIGPTRARALEQLRRLALRAGFQLEDGFA